MVLSWRKLGGRLDDCYVSNVRGPDACVESRRGREASVRPAFPCVDMGAPRVGHCLPAPAGLSDKRTANHR